MKLVPTGFFCCMVLSAPAWAASSDLKPAALAPASVTDAWLSDWDRVVAQAIRPAGGDWLSLKIRGQLRTRYELRSEFDFNKSSGENDGFVLQRSRVSADATAFKRVEVFAEGQDAQSLTANVANKTSAFEDNFDLRQLWVQAPVGQPVRLQVGRQELSFGDERLLGNGDWSVGRTFDAVRATWAPAGWALDGFAGNVVIVDDNNPNESDHRDDVYGLYASFTGIPKQTFDSFLLTRHNSLETAGERAGRRGELEEWTWGHRLRGAWRWFDYGLEGAWQFGHRGGEPLRAWAFHADGAYTAPVAWSPKLLVEYNHATGDEDPADGRRQTFDNLFPGNHNKYGYLDFVGLRNINDTRLSVSAKPVKPLTVSADVHWLYLDERRDSWYNASGAAVRTDATGAASAFVGRELDLLAVYAVDRRLNLLIGYSHFFAGPFLKDTGANDDADWFYTQATLTF